MKPLKGQGLPTPRSGAAWLGGETVSVLSEGARMAALKATDTWTPPLETLSQSGGAGPAQGFTSSPGDSEAQPELKWHRDREAFRGRLPGGHFTSLRPDVLISKRRIMRVPASRALIETSPCAPAHSGLHPCHFLSSVTLLRSHPLPTSSPNPRPGTGSLAA